MPTEKEIEAAVIRGRALYVIRVQVEIRPIK